MKKGWENEEGKRAELIASAIEELCISECPSCNRPFDLPTSKDIENWLNRED